jgi:hypothetical protein
MIVPKEFNFGELNVIGANFIGVFRGHVLLVMVRAGPSIIASRAASPFNWMGKIVIVICFVADDTAWQCHDTTTCY